MGESNQVDTGADSGIAIIGMAGRFPGASDVSRFWENVKNGVESVSFFSADELELGDESASILAQPNFVKAKGILDNVEGFDAAFFGFNPREAELLDPQHRLFLECAWHALEDAGYESSRCSGRIGVYGGASANTYLLNIYSNRALLNSIDPFQLLISSDKDFLTTRVSYKLGLSGPSVTVQTACSTSLVAVHLACQSLLGGECDMALAGGVSITLPQKAGYLYQEGSFLSPDGHCRAFDENAKGTVSGNGAGIVVLKRLDDALTDRDYIFAVIKGSAINNDAAMKAGYTAPSVTAQATVVAEALAVAGVDADTVSYVEAHGTGTTLGDPVEVAALTKAFRMGTPRSGYCALGSVKTNIGHLDAAAGAASLIKVAMALSEKKLPPSLHFTQPNPQLSLKTSPFYVNTELKDWNSDTPRRAGVSSFGIGGTNAHIVLEEAPEPSVSGHSRPYSLITLSAKTASALDRLSSNLADYLNRRPDVNLTNAAYTLQVGRRSFAHRRILVCSDSRDAAAILAHRDSSRVIDSEQVSDDPPVVFMFPGQGSQYVGMARGLYENEELFRREVDHCAELLAPLTGSDLRTVIYPESPQSDENSNILAQTAVAQAALFVVEYALARLLMDWGVTPSAMIGHSIGEYTAACLGGVFNLEDALKLVAARGKLMQQSQPGGMLAVSLGEKAAREVANGKLSIAAVNGPSLVVVSGPNDEIDSLKAEMTDRRVRVRRLYTSHAFHSSMMDPILKPFEEEVRCVRLRPPKIRYVSNVTGNWITPEQATDPAYWAEHLRQTVRFSDGLALLAKSRPGVFLEVGPGRTLAAHARGRSDTSGRWTVVNTLQPHDGREPDAAFLLGSLGRLWLSGVKVDWSRFHAGQDGRRVPLPGYPFERKRYWIDFQTTRSDAAAPAPAGEKVVTAPMHERPTTLASRYLAPENETEQTLAEIWQEVFGIETVGIQDEFFALGGHSLLATQLIAEVREAFEIDLPLQKLFETPTIAGLAVAVEEALIRKIDRLSEDDVQKLLL